MTAPLRILVCTKRDLAGCLILNTLLPRLSGCAVMVLLSDRTRAVEASVPELAEMKFLERDLPVDTLFPLIDRLPGAEAAPLATFDGCAARYRVPVQVVDDINGPAGEALVRGFAPDLIVSARFSLIFKANIFEIPRFGTYNLHPGALPRHAGLFAPFRCLMAGEPRLGCTLHRVDACIDSGPVAGMGWLAVEPGRSLLWHILNAYRPGLDLLPELLETVRAGLPVRVEPQDRGLRRYGSLPGPEEFREFRARGLRLYDPAEYREILGGFLAPARSLPLALALPGQPRRAGCCSARG